VLSGANFISAAGDIVMIRFPKKKVPFYFNHSRDSDVRSRSQKDWKFKRFGSLWRPREGTATQRTKSYQLIRHDHLPKVKKEVLA
jgi:hypothetical protein